MSGDHSPDRTTERDELDELFGQGAGAARPRVGLVLGLLGAGVLLALLGMACTPAVGGVLVLLALYVADKESARVESGYLPVSERATVKRLRSIVVAVVVLVAVLFVFQLVLLSFGLYNDLWMGTIEQLAAWREALYPPPDPPDPGLAPDPGAPAAPGSPH